MTAEARAARSLDEGLPPLNDEQKARVDERLVECVCLLECDPGTEDCECACAMHRLEMRVDYA